MLNCGCGSGEVCCDGSCHHRRLLCRHGVWPLGQYLHQQRMLLRCRPTLHGRQTDVLPDLRGCANLVTDPKSCGECDFACSDSEVCCDGTCANMKSDDVLNCGECGNRCADGESCVEGTCQCGTSDDQVRARPDLRWSHTCEDCTDQAKGCAVASARRAQVPHGDKVDNDRFLLRNRLQKRVSVAATANVAKTSASMRARSGNRPASSAAGRPIGYVCKNPDAPEDRTQDLCCEDEKCSCFNQSGRFGSNRRPGR